MMAKKKEVNERKDRSEQAGVQTSRRFFISYIWKGLGIVALVELVVVIIQYFKPGRNRIIGADTESVMTAGSIDQFPAGSVTAFIKGKFYLCRLDDGGLLALSRQCTHLGCTVPWDENKKQFICPCHSSIFDIRGEVIRSPASRPLDIYPVKIVNSQVKIDISKPIRRMEFRAEQVVYADGGKREDHFG